MRMASQGVSRRRQNKRACQLRPTSACSRQSPARTAGLSGELGVVAGLVQVLAEKVAKGCLIPASTAAVLREHRRKQLEMRVALGARQARRAIEAAMRTPGQQAPR
jgi:hypothetical protein